MKSRLSIVLTTATTALWGCASVSTPAAAPVVARGALTSASGVPTGTATLTRSGGQLLLNIAVVGLTPGQHGIHLHSVGRCDGPEFKTAAGHLNPMSRRHGLDNPAGSHLGDMPNLVVDASGSGSLSHVLPGSADRTLGEIFDADGTAIVVHAGVDDQRSDPSGNSGARIACGVLSPA